MLIQVWRVHGELYGLPRVYGCENPPTCTPDGVRDHFKKIMPELVITKIEPHPGGISVVKSLSDASVTAESIQRAQELLKHQPLGAGQIAAKESLDKLMDGATITKTD